MTIATPNGAPAVALLSDPFLQWPEGDRVRVVWFTEFVGGRHWLEYGEDWDRTAIAVTTCLTHLREDGDSHLPPTAPRPPEGAAVWARPVWRHEAIATGLGPGQRWPYRVCSDRGDAIAVSAPFTLAANPPAGAALQILLTSDHQLKPMTAANLAAVERTIGRVDAVFHAGDLANIPDRASEWFDDASGLAFFPCLQGRAARTTTHGDRTRTDRGGALIQHAPLFPTLGNHEVMGRRGLGATLRQEFCDPIPRAAAAALYETPPAELPPEAVEDWWKARSFNTDTYEALFSLPDGGPGGKRYYATTVGDVRLISLCAACAWRPPTLTRQVPGCYGERPVDLGERQRWGWGQFIFEPIAPGSAQYEWLRSELSRPEFRAAKYKIVMLHHPPHSLGDNVVPPFVDPVQRVEHDDSGAVSAVHYDYPRDRDYLIEAVVPLLAAAGVQLVYFGHSHLWNRFAHHGDRGTLHFLESSNVGNSYGACWDGDNRRSVPSDAASSAAEHYASFGDPNGLMPIVPTIAPQRDARSGEPLPFLASNEVTAFSILDTAAGAVRSYCQDVRRPEAPAVLFDEFFLEAAMP